jgi:hypothetical protein
VLGDFRFAAEGAFLGPSRGFPHTLLTWGGSARLAS